MDIFWLKTLKPIRITRLIIAQLHFDLLGIRIVEAVDFSFLKILSESGEWRGWARPDNGLQMTPYSTSLLHKVFTIIYVTNAPQQPRFRLNLNKHKRSYQRWNKLWYCYLIFWKSVGCFLMVRRLICFLRPGTSLRLQQAQSWCGHARPFTASLVCWYPWSLNCFGFVRVLTFATIGVENLGAEAACGLEFSRLYVLSM